MGKLIDTWDRQFSVGYPWNSKVDGNNMLRIIALFRFLE